MNQTTLFTASLMVALSACSSIKSHKQPIHSSNVPLTAQTVAQSANQATQKLKKSKKIQTGIIAYFDSNGNRQNAPQAGGFYRQLLGRNQAGQAIVQDFYQDSQTKQTNPMVIPNDADLYNFDSAQVEGRVVWYAPDGKIKQFIDYHNGLVQRGGYYNDAGILVLETEGDNSKNPNAPLKMRGFYDNGHLLFENKQEKNTSESVFYYDSGQKMWHGVSNSEAIHAWSRDGKPVELSDIEKETEQAEKQANLLIMRYYNN